MIVDMDGDEDPSSWSSHRSSPSRKRGSSAEGKQCAKTAELSLQSTSIPVSQWYGDTILKMRMIMVVIAMILIVIIIMESILVSHCI